ncbi:MAG: sensor histidine kinase [Firmicutes bacterium]|nr:sensor histidine kinase [Bacillota bacterium]
MDMELKQILELLAQPVFLARDGSVIWCNGAARGMLAEGLPVSSLLENNAMLYEVWSREGVLHLPIILGGAEYDASVLAMQAGDLFLAARRPQEVNATAAAVEHASVALRKPLHTMLNAANALFEQLEETQTEQIPAAAELNQALYRLIRLCGQMSDGAQLLLHRREAHREPTDIARFLTDFVSAARPLTESVGVQLLFTPPGRPLRGDIDCLLLERALYNLVANALAHCPSGSTITLSAQKQDFFLLLRVMDNGNGIEEGVLSTIFERFSASEFGAASQGIGLGLPIVREIARLHGGTIAVNGNPEGGTCVTLTLSLAPSVLSLRSRMVRYDGYGDLNHALVELSDVLPPEIYDPAEI